MKTIKFFTGLISFLLIAVSCQQEQTPISTDDVNMADDEAVAEAIFDDVFASADNVVQVFDAFLKGLTTIFSKTHPDK